MNGKRRSLTWMYPALACLALVLCGCARKPAGRAANESGQGSAASPAAIAGRLPCLDGLKTYKFGGQFAFDPGGAAARQQIGSLANLLKDVRFDGAFAAPDATRLHVSFPGGASQDLETVQVQGKKYQRVGDGTWESATADGGGPLLTALAALDPRTLCAQTLATVDTSHATPVSETLNSVAVQHYRFGTADLAGSSGLFGQGRGNDRGQTEIALDVWTAARGGYPVRIAVKSSDAQQGGTFAITLDISDVNGKDIAIKAPL